MLRTISLLALSLVFFWSLPGCYCAAGLGKAPWKQKAAQMEPSIEGAWSEPVNGVRMRMMHVMPFGGEQPEITLLFFAQNIGEKEVNLPRLRPEHYVNVMHGGQQLQGLSDATLRIIAQPMDDQPPRGGVSRLLELSQEAEAQNPMQPGEMRVFAVKIVAEEQMKYLHQQSPDTIYAETISWPGLASEKSAGRWRVHAVYRPSGFNTDRDAQIEWVVDQAWVDQQIDLPVTVLKIDPWHYNRDGRIEQLNER